MKILVQTIEEILLTTPRKMTSIVPQYLDFNIHNGPQNLDAIACVYTLVEIIYLTRDALMAKPTPTTIYSDFSLVVVFEDCVLDNLIYICIIIF